MTASLSHLTVLVKFILNFPAYAGMTLKGKNNENLKHYA